MDYDFDRIIDRRHTNAVKWDYLQTVNPLAGPSTLPFWVADMDFAVAEPIKRALVERVEHGVFGYAVTDPGYEEAIVNWYQRYHGWDIAAESICFAPGLVAGIGLLLALLTKPGDGVIIQEPVYYPFRRKIVDNGCRPIVSPLVEDAAGRYEMDFDDLERHFQQHKLMILCSPHNPGGRVWSRGELLRLAELAQRHGVYIIADEIHNDLLRQGQQHHVLAQLVPEYAGHIISGVSASKSFNIAALECASLIITDAQLRRKWRNYVEGKLSIHGPSLLALVATKAAYNEGRPWLEALCAYLDGNFAWLQQQFAAALPEARFNIPEGTYLGWLDVRAYNQDTAALVDELLRQEQIMVQDGGIFGSNGRGFLRFNAACPRALLQQAMPRLCAVIREQRPH